MIPRFLSLASVLSLLLCMATIITWIRSYNVRSSVIWVPANWTMLVSGVTLRGQAGVFCQNWAGAPTAAEFAYESIPVTPYSDGLARVDEMDVHVRTAGFIYATFLRPDFHVYFVGVPLWTIAAATLLLPLLRLRLWLRPTRRDPNICRQCGYDLGQQGPLPRMRNACFER